VSIISSLPRIDDSQQEKSLSSCEKEEEIMWVKVSRCLAKLSWDSNWLMRPNAAMTFGSRT